MTKKIVIGVGILVGIIAVLMATGVFKFNVSVTPSSKEAAQKEFVLPEGWQKYSSGEFGYTVAYPDTWNLSEKNSDGSRDLLIVIPGNKAFVRITGYKDFSLSSKESVEASIEEYKASFNDKPNEQLEKFQSKMEGKIGAFEAAGLMLANDVQYRFLERGLLATNGRVLIMRGSVSNAEGAITQKEFEELSATVRKIMDSFRPL